MDDVLMYEVPLIERIFADMAPHYWINALCSFGLAYKWRREALDLISLRGGMRVADLMTGSGEAWRFILRTEQPLGELIAVDSCSAILQRAALRAQNDLPVGKVTLLHQDATRLSLHDGELQAVVGCFALKTLSSFQVASLAGEVARVLAPGGEYVFLDLRVPGNRVLRKIFLGYLRYVVPFVGALAGGKCQGFRVLGRYVERSLTPSEIARLFMDSGLEVQVKPMFTRCAFAVWGRRTRN